jgi:plastocyanin
MRRIVPAAFALLLGGAAPDAAPTVTIDNFSFTAAEITVPVGARVTWLNRDDIPHTVTDAGEKRGFRSPPLDTGESFSQVFPQAGTWHYFCSLHPHMQGTVVVR